MSGAGTEPRRGQASSSISAETESGRESGIGFSPLLPARYKISNIEKGKEKKKKVDPAVTLLSAQTALSGGGDVFPWSPGPALLQPSQRSSKAQHGRSQHS